MFQKNPICLKKRPICCPYVVLSEGFSSPYVEKAPYVAKQVPICGPYAAHMWPICFGCSSVEALLSVFMVLGGRCCVRKPREIQHTPSKQM